MAFRMRKHKKPKPVRTETGCICELKHLGATLWLETGTASDGRRNITEWLSSCRFEREYAPASPVAPAGIALKKMRLSLSVLDVPAARRFFYENQGNSFVLFYRERGDGEGNPEEELELFRSQQASLDLAELSFEVVKHIQGITQTA